MNPLFPVSAVPENDNNPITSFPSFKSFPTEEETTATQNEGSLDWLENQSFPVQQLTTEASNVSIEESVPLYQAVDSHESNQEEKAVKKHDNSSSEDDYHKEKKKRKKEKHKHKKKKHKSEKERNVSPYRGDDLDIKRKKTIYGNKVFIDEIRDLEAKDAFRIDRKSNAENWNYQSLYKGHVAKFHDTYRTCIGQTDGKPLYVREKIEKDVKKEKKRYYSKENARVANRAPIERLCTDDTSAKNGQTVLPEKLLLPSEPITKERIRDVDVREKLLDADTKLYVEGKGSVKDDIDEGEISADVLASHRKIEEYNRKLREDPHNVPLWLEFVKYQDKRSDPAVSATKGKEDVKISKLALHEKKVAIMKKAMESNQGNLELKMKYLELCQETWEPHQISKEIEDMLFVQPTNLSLWQHYLLFHQSRLSSFSVTRMSKMYQKCLKTLLKYSTGRVHTAVSTGDVPQKMLVILGQYLNFLKQTGLTERAIATFQALVEFNLFCPIKYKEESLENRKALFESFWDSNVPRVGEEVAKGWSFYAENKVVEPTKKTEDEASLSDEQKIIDEKLSKQQTWLKIEQLRSLNHWLPWRPDISKDETEEDCEDVDRLVLFDDISPFLIDIPESLCFDLIYAFLQTIGAGEERSLTSDLMSQCYVEDLSSLSQNMQVMLSLNNFSRNSSVVESFVTAVCQQTGKVLNSEHKTNLALLMLNYKADKVIQSVNQTSAAIKSIKSLFKSVLKEPENRENVDIWMRYAQLLWKCGQNQEAIGILEMAISLLGPKKGQDVIQMYRVLVELLLGFTEVERLCSMGRKDQRNDVNPSKALSVLSCLVEGKHQNVKKYESVSPIAILKCGKTLETLTNASWLKIQEEIGEDGNLCLRRYLECVKCKALFEYINTSSKIDTATSVLNQALVEMYKFADSHSVSISDLDPCNASDKVTGTVSKLLYDIFKYKVRLVQHHMNLSSYPLQNLRSVIDAALELFPNDSCFLQAFLDCEKGSHFLGRVDRYFSRSLSRVTSLVPVVYAVMSQLERMMVDDTQVPNTGALNRVRAYLERGLESKEIQHCPLLWRLYLQLEAKFNQLKNAQGVFYRAVQHCPWSKAIYMDAVSLLKEDKMEEILDLMTEKELRMQILLEEIDILSS